MLRKGSGYHCKHGINADPVSTEHSVADMHVEACNDQHSHIDTRNGEPIWAYSAMMDNLRLRGRWSCSFLQIYSNAEEEHLSLSLIMTDVKTYLLRSAIAEQGAGKQRARAVLIHVVNILDAVGAAEDDCSAQPPSPYYRTMHHFDGDSAGQGAGDWGM